MGIQEIEAAIVKLPPEELRTLSIWFEALLAQQSDLSTPANHRKGSGDQASAKRLKERKTLANAARRNWKGGEGLAYQDRIRHEWDDNPGGDI